MTDDNLSNKKNPKDPQGLLAPKTPAKKPKKTKRTKRTVDISPKEPIGELKNQTCRKCRRRRALKEFYIATDKLLDTSGYMSVCKHCLEDLFEKFYVNENSLEKAILKICRLMNMKYDAVALEATRKHIETLESKGKNVGGVVGIYRKGLVGGGYDRFGSANDEDLMFYEPIRYDAPGLNPDEYVGNTVIGLEKFWGKGFTEEEYQFLEDRLAEWKSSYSCQTKSEEFYMKEACLKELDLRRAREGRGGSVDAITKSMNELLKAAALTPAQTNAADSGKSFDTWGTIIKQIEETTPAEYYKDKGLFKDFDGIEKKYIIPYIVRSLKNFVLGSRDFNITEDSDEYNEIIGEVEVDDSNGSASLSGE